MKSKSTVFVLGLWAVLVLAGYGMLSHYSATAGTGNTSTPAWPRDSQVTRKQGMPTLMLFIHPQCPCSRATIEELSNLLAQTPREVDTVGVFIRPADFEDGWEQTDLWTKFSGQPGARVMADPEGSETRRFGAATSGFTMLFDVEGKLVFSGGITSGRGHQGSSVGKDAILHWLHGEEIEIRESPVFGCPLFDES